jgi:hypothetical protein
MGVSVWIGLVLRRMIPSRPCVVLGRTIPSSPRVAPYGMTRGNSTNRHWAPSDLRPPSLLLPQAIAAVAPLPPKVPGVACRGGSRCGSRVRPVALARGTWVCGGTPGWAPALRLSDVAPSLLCVGRAGSKVGCGRKVDLGSGGVGC